MHKYSLQENESFITFAQIWTLGKLVHTNRYAKFKKSTLGSAGRNSL